MIAKQAKHTLIYSILFSMFLGQSFVFAQEIPSTTDWITVGDSPTLDRSSSYLANGNIKLGIRYANKALKRSKSPLKDVIANHNLCIAWTMEGNSETALHFCEKVSSLQIPEMSLKKVREGLYKVSKRGYRDSGVALNTLISHNLAFYQVEKDASQLAQSE